MIKKITWAFAIVLGIVAIACEKDVLNETVEGVPPFDEDWGTGDTIKITSQFYVKGKIDTNLVAFQDTVDGYLGYVSNHIYADSNSQFQPFGCDSFHSQRGQKWYMASNFIGEIEQIEIEFVHCMNDTALTPEQLAPISIGSHPFGRVTRDTLNPGVRISYMSADSIVYRSDWGSGATQGAYFYISRVDSVMGADTVGGHLIITGEFETELHNDIYGSIPIEAGEFRIRIGESFYP